MKFVSFCIALCLAPLTLSSLESEGSALPEFSAPNANRDWKKFYFSRGTAFRNGPKKKPYALGRFKHSQIKDSSVAWKWGSRSGIGYNVDAENWNIVASYSRFHTKLFAAPKKLAVDTWRLHLDMADMEIGRGFEFAKAVLLRPHMGLRGAFFYQKKKAIPYKELTAVEMQSREPFLASDCLGLGVRSGLDSLWNIGQGISLFGDGAFSFLAGYQSVRQKSKAIEEEVSLIKEAQKERTGLTTAEIALGLQYAKDFFSEKKLTIRLGYDMNYVLNQEQWTNWVLRKKDREQERESGVSLQGVSLGIRLDY